MVFLTVVAHTEPVGGPITHIYLFYNAAEASGDAGYAESFEYLTSYN